ncbi:MAG: hypothetical protein WBJ83_03865 [Thermacetogeniaceae bacterium]|jgi:hypothetical protein|nr:DUF5320 domain-containing protein [Syntrophomonadaceae bacterium]
MCRSGHYHHGGCGCCCGGGFNRRFFTKEEKIAKLENYLKDLKAEMAAVEDKIKRLKEEK